jgi:hypothetical protein
LPIHYQLHTITAHRSPITDHRSPITAYRSPITDHRLPITAYRPPSTVHRPLPSPLNTSLSFLRANVCVFTLKNASIMNHYPYILLTDGSITKNHLRMKNKKIDFYFVVFLFLFNFIQNNNFMIYGCK